MPVQLRSAFCDPYSTGLRLKSGGFRVGIVGRGGSGKSTLFQALAIIPQDPTLFMGTLGSNLDRTSPAQKHNHLIAAEQKVTGRAQIPRFC